MPEEEFEGKVVVVTGSGGGIGAATAAAFASRGARVLVNDVDADLARETAEKIGAQGGRAIGVPADVSSPAEVDRMMATARAELGEIDVLVNNAARMPYGPFVDITLDTWDSTIAANLRGPFLCMQAVLPAMIERRRGAIVNLTSIAAMHTTTPHVAYAASKAGVMALTRDVAVEVAPFGVRVNAVAPGPTDSHGWGMTRESVGVPYTRPGRPDDIANAIVFLASDAAEYVVGETLVVAGGANLKVGTY
jgi:NAD(P)-dependent dehydrogenase (short-subunit alcohol dehydrogenase family)